MKDELGGKITKKFVGLRAKICSYLTNNYNEDKKAKVTGKCFIKRKLKLEDFRNCLEAAQTKNKMNHSVKNKIEEDSLKQDNKEFI